MDGATQSAAAGAATGASTIGQPAPRLYFLDGLRGWGALIVVLYHVFVEVQPVTKASSDFLRHVFLFNGTLAVWTFFLVSGFSLSVGFIRTRDRTALQRQAFSRYFRLAIPILAFSLLYYAAFALGAIPPAAARPADFAKALNLDPGFLETVRFALYDVFFSYDPATSIIPPLWTMAVELIGSFLVLGLCALLSGSRWRFLGYAAVFALLALHGESFILAFVCGLAAADAFVTVPPARLAAVRWLAPLGAILAAAAAWFLPEFSQYFYYLAVASALFAGLMCWPSARRFLETPFSRFLGRISFPLYLVHVLVLWTVTLQAFRWLGIGAGEQPVARLVIGLLTVAVALAVARLLAFVDWAGIRFSQALARRLV